MPPVVSSVTYPADVLAERVKRRLEETPAVCLATLASEYGVSCRTVRRALTAQLGISFRGLQAQSLRVHVDRLRRGDGVRSLKEVAYALGYRSPKAFSRRMKTITGDVPRGVRHAPE